MGVRNSDAVASRLQVSDLYKSDLQVSSQFANDLMWKKLKFLCINKVNWWFLDLKTLQVFFKNRGEILIWKKMLYFLSFLVLLANKQGEFVIFDYQSEKVQVARKIFVMGCILKYYLQNMWKSTILDNFLKKLLQNFSFFDKFSWVFWLGK